MATRIACIVEGKGDALSVPILVRRVGAAHGVFDLEFVGPYRVPRSTLIREGEIERAVERAARAAGAGGVILVLIDADDDLPCKLGPALQHRAAAARPDLAVAVVLANREKEAWFLAALESLRGRRGISEDADPPAEPEAIRGAKERLSVRYSEVTDEPALTSLFDLETARERSRSFDKFYREVSGLLTR